MLPLVTTDPTGGRRLSRRTLLGGGAALAAAGTGGVATGLLPGRSRVVSAIDAVLPVPSPSSQPADLGPVLTGRFRSRARRGTEVGWVVAYPPRVAGAADAGLPVALALHGQGGDASVVTALHLPGYLADAVAAGSPPFAIAAVDGGLGYWHRRRNGDDAQAMLLEEFWPKLAGVRDEHGRRLAAGGEERFALLGWSAGGFGALLLAQRLGVARVAAVAAVSPALWRRAEDTADGAFDDAADFAAHDVFAGRPRLAAVRVRIDGGWGDPFVDAAQDFAAGLLPPPAGGFGFGAHDDAYWRRLAPDQLRFVGGALA
jgi:predicted esterase